MPHAKLLTFEHADPVDLRAVLPHIPVIPQDVASNDAGLKSSVLDLLDRLLLCSPSARMTPTQALEHPWLSSENIPLLYPDTLRKEEQLWKGHGLGHWFLEVLN